MKLGTALVEALAAEGVEMVFGLIGGGIEDVAAEIAARPGMRFVKVRHEEVAVSMADGYSRATGQIGVALLDGHPGIANASAAMLAARMGNSRLLALFPHNVTTSRYDFALPNRQSNMVFDQGKLLDATIGAWDLIRSPDTLSEDVARAFRRLRLGRGPLALGVTGQTTLMPDGWRYTPRGRMAVEHRPLVPGDKDVDAVVEMLSRAERPVLLAGRGAWMADAREAIIALADRAGALVATTLLAKDWFRGYPYAVGIAGGFASDPAFDILRQADLVVALGTSLNDYTLGHGRLFPDARIVHIDNDPAALAEYSDIDRGILGDARLAAEEIGRATAPSSRPDWHGPAMAVRIARADRFRGLDMTDGTAGANPRALVDAIDRLAPDDRLLVTDIGIFQGLPAMYVGVPTPGDIVFPWPLGRVGVGLPVAAGAALGRPDRLVILFAGDGGMMAATNTLDTIRTEGIALLVVVMDDAGFGAERRIFELLGVNGSAVDSYDTPNLEAIAKAYGFSAHTVTSTAEMEQLLGSIELRGRTTLIHAVLDKTFRAIEMDRAIYDRDAPRSTTPD